MGKIVLKKYRKKVEPLIKIDKKGKIIVKGR